MKIFLFPNYNSSYDIRMVKGLGKAFIDFGHEVKIFRQPVSSSSLEILVKEYNPDLIFQINQFRPTNMQNKKFRHVSWFQDVFPSTVRSIPNNFKDGDIVYTLGNKESLGLENLRNVKHDCLVTGVDPVITKFNSKNTILDIDCSLCGFIPTIPEINTKRSAYIRWTLANIIRKIPVIRSIDTVRLFLNILGSPFPKQMLYDMMSIVEMNYESLSGNLNIKTISDKLIKIAQKYCYYEPANIQQKINIKEIKNLGIGKNIYSSNLAVENLIDWCSREYPRYLDRHDLVEKLQNLNIALRVYGKGWERFSEFKNFFFGEITNLTDLLNVYQNSKVNLSNNTHGLGLHSRVLECMAVGGFILMHNSPNDNKPGGILTEFEEGKHFSFYNYQNLQNEIVSWLKDEQKRKKIAENARLIIQKKHLWKHRASQILKDL